MYFKINYTKFLHIYAKNYMCVNCLGGHVGKAFASSVEGRECEPRSGQVKDLDIGACCFHG